MESDWSDEAGDDAIDAVVVIDCDWSVTDSIFASAVEFSFECSLIFSIFFPEKSNLEFCDWYEWISVMVGCCS